MIPHVLIMKVSGGGTARTWRRPTEIHVAAAVCMAIFPVLPGWWLGKTLVANQVPNGGWIAMELSVAAWGILAWRTLVYSVTLTQGTLVIRNIFTTRKIPLTQVTGVGFRRGALKVTTIGHGGAPGKRFTVSVAALGSHYWSGLRSAPDALAEAISYAVGLPSPPPRRQIISQTWAWVILVAAVACMAFGFYTGPMQSGTPGRSLALVVAGAMPNIIGVGMLGSAFGVIRDHRRKRAQQGRR